MSDMIPTGSKWSDEDRTQAAIHYAVTGSLTKVEKALGIPDSTVCAWKQQSWWDELVGKVRNEKLEEHRAIYIEIVDKAQAQTLKALPKATAQQAMIIAGTATDKVRLHDGKPTSITKSATGLDAMVKKFEAIADSYNERQARVVSNQ